MHISGLEVEGRHPRALMESALLLLQQVIGLAGPAPRADWKEARLPVTPSLDTRAISRIVFRLGSAAVRLVVSKKCPDDPGVLVGNRYACLRRSQFSLLVCNPSATRICFLGCAEDY